MKLMNEPKKIPANIEAGVLIKEIDKYAIHVRLTKLTMNPKDPLNIGRSDLIRCFPIATFEKMEAMRYQKSPLVWYVAGGFKEAKIVHDGRLEEKPEVVKPTESELEAKKVKDAELRKQKRLQNLAAARATKAANNA
jgi:hypothetical protein